MLSLEFRFDLYVCARGGTGYSHPLNFQKQHAYSRIWIRLPDSAPITAAVHDAGLTEYSS